jgi:AraC family transcriptional regulator
MSAVDSVSMDSYLNAHPGAPVLSSLGLGWHGITVTFDHFRPFERDTFCYREHLVCLNLGRRAARLTHSMGSRSFQGRIRRGECFVAPAGQPIKWQLKTEADGLSILLQPAFVREVGESIGLHPDRTELLYRIPVRDRDIEAVGRLMFRELKSGGLGGRVLAESLANGLVVYLLRRQSARPPSHVDQLEGLSERCRKQVVDYVQEKLCDASLSLADLAGVAGVSPYHFARAFHRSVGMPPTGTSSGKGSSGRSDCCGRVRRPLPPSPPPSVFRTRATFVGTSSGSPESRRRGSEDRPENSKNVPTTPSKIVQSEHDHSRYR